MTATRRLLVSANHQAIRQVANQTGFEDLLAAITAIAALPTAAYNSIGRWRLSSITQAATATAAARTTTATGGPELSARPSQAPTATTPANTATAIQKTAPLAPNAGAGLSLSVMRQILRNLVVKVTGPRGGRLPRPPRPSVPRSR